MTIDLNPNSPVDCASCSNIITSKVDKTITKCGHVFHKFCLDMWILQYHKCPVCHTYIPLTSKESAECTSFAFQFQRDSIALGLPPRLYQFLKKAQPVCALENSKEKLSQIRALMQEYEKISNDETVEFYVW